MISPFKFKYYALFMVVTPESIVNLLKTIVQIQSNIKLLVFQVSMIKIHLSLLTNIN